MPRPGPTGPERGIVREALLATGMDRPGLRDAAAAVRDWDRVLALAEAGYVSETVWAGLVRGGAADLVPEPAASRLRDAHLDATARNGFLVAEATRVQGVLDGAGIASVVVKGPGLLLSCYPDLGARRVSDVDLLVRSADTAGAERALAAAAVRPAGPGVDYDAESRRVGQMAGHGEIGLVTDSGIVVEIQDRIAGGAGDGSDVPGLLARSMEVPWQGRTLRVPALPDLVAGLCLHVFDHHGADERFIARHLADLAVSVGSGRVGWDEVSARMAPGHGALALAFSRRLLEEGAPPGRTLWRHGVAMRARHWQRNLAGRGEEPVSVLRVLFPSPEYMAHRYGVRPGSPIVPLLYAWRPFRGAWGLITGR